MVNINISIKKEAYDFLSRLKTKDKSFSEVILDFKDREKERSGKSLLKFAGGLKNLNIDWEEKEKRMKEFRSSFNRSIEEIAKYREKPRK